MCVHGSLGVFSQGPKVSTFDKHGELRTLNGEVLK